jgi:hypothetical protein
MIDILLGLAFSSIFAMGYIFFKICWLFVKIFLKISFLPIKIIIH